MSCQEINGRLDDYVDGSLSPDERGRVEEHLAGCAACREELEALRGLLDSAAGLAREIEPGHDLWPSIEGRLARAEPAVARGGWRSQAWVGLAAAAALVAAVTIQVSRQADSPETAGAEPVEPVAVEAAASFSVISEEVRVRNGLQQVREDLLRSIIERRESLDPETQELVDRNLELIDQAVAEIYQALEENPENQRLEFLLAATYQREVEFLKKMNLL
jgi:hypothetical protein